MAVSFGSWVWGNCRSVPGMGVQVVGAEGIEGVKKPACGGLGRLTYELGSDKAMLFSCSLFDI